MQQEREAVAFTIDATDPLVVFGALAALIFLGFLGNLVFSRLRFNDTLILILVGVVVGPVLGFVDQASMLALSGIVGPLALILILFDGGLALKFRDLAQGLGSAALLGVVGFVATTTIVGALTALLLDVSMLRGMILGSILGGTSALVVLPSLEHMKVQKRTGTILGLESALTDVLVVVVTFTLIAIAAAGVAPVELVAAGDADADGLADAWEVEHFGDLNATAEGDPDEDGRSNLEEMRQGSNPLLADEGVAGGGGFDPQSITSKLLITFAMSIFMGLAAGLVWLLLYPRLREKPFGYMLTLGFMFAVYVFVEWILQDVSSGGGPLAVLAFGIILGNNQSLGPLGRRVGDDFGTGMKRFQGEISFLVRTFFFVFLGIIVDLALIADVRILGISLVLLFGMAMARYVAVVMVTRRVVPRGDDLVMLVMMPRGLAAAVLAAVPASVMLPHLGVEGIPGTHSFVALAFLLLVWTNLLATVGGIVLEKKGLAGEPTTAARGAGGTTGRGPGAGAAANRKAGPSKTGRGGKASKGGTVRGDGKTGGKTGGKAGRTGRAAPAGGRQSPTQAALEGMGRHPL